MRHSFARGISKRRISRYVDVLLWLSNALGKGFKEVSRRDMEDAMMKLECSSYTEWTKATNKMIVKLFYKWLYNTDVYPDVVRWIKVKKVIKKRLPEELLTPEEVKRMIDACNHIRDKALVSFLYESGCRVGELLNLRIRDVEFMDNICYVMLNGKTGMRRIPIINSVPYLANWIENHPLRDDRNAYVFVSLVGKNRKSRMGYTAVRLLLRDIAKRAGIKKRVNPHNFRHSRATELASKITEQQLKKYFGWSSDSKMAAVYVHLSGRIWRMLFSRLMELRLRRGGRRMG